MSLFVHTAFLKEDLHFRGKHFCTDKFQHKTNRESNGYDWCEKYHNKPVVNFLLTYFYICSEILNFTTPSSTVPLHQMWHEPLVKHCVNIINRLHCLYGTVFHEAHQNLGKKIMKKLCSYNIFYYKDYLDFVNYYHMNAWMHKSNYQ